MPVVTETVLAVFILFCRIGTCLMLMPGLSSTRVPARVRLFLALAITLALAPLLFGTVATALANISLQGLVSLIISELLIGAMIGVLARLFFLALEALANAATMAIGFGALPGTSIEEPEPQPALVSLIMMAAVTLLFVTNQHWEILRGLTASYRALPVTPDFESRLALSRMTDALSGAFLVALRITSPFIVYAVVVNFSIGLTNKLTPQIPVYFISLPFVLFGGLVFLYFIAPELLHLFIDGFASWLATG
jgi:flagellar biosynthesis protein FliR